MKRKSLLALLLASAMTFNMTGVAAMAEETTAAENTTEETEAADTTSADTKTTRVVEDFLGRSVELPEEIKSMAIVPAPWASVVYALNGSGEIIKGVQKGAKTFYENSILKEFAPEMADMNTGFFVDGELNFEELAKIDPDVMLLFTRQESFIEKLDEVGIPAVTIEYATSYDSLWKDFEIIGNVLNKQERAQEFITYQKDDIAYLEGKADELNADEPVKVMQLYSATDLSVADNSGIENSTIELCGGINVGETTEDASSETQVNFEQILAWNPDIIFLSNWNDVTPDDLYENKIEGQDWSQIKAVQDKRVYKIPQGIYLWDTDCPCTETTLGAKWMAKLINPEVFKEIDIRQDTKDFYQKFFQYELSDEQLDKMLALDVNANSQQLLEE